MPLSAVAPRIEMEFSVNVGSVAEVAHFEFKDFKLFDVLNFNAQHFPVGEIIDKRLYSRNVYGPRQKVQSGNLLVMNF